MFYCAMRCLDMWKKTIVNEFMYVILFSYVKKFVSNKKKFTCDIFTTVLKHLCSIKSTMFVVVWKTCILFSFHWERNGQSFIGAQQLIFAPDLKAV